MIKAEDNIKLTTNDLEMAIECNVKADVVEKRHVVNARLFGEIIRKMPDSTIHIEADTETI